MSLHYTKPHSQHAKGDAKIVYYDIVYVKLGNIYKVEMISDIRGNLACHTKE